MKYQAVIFDFGGTLVRNAGWNEYEEAARMIAEHISAPVDEFTTLWFAESSRLGTGNFQTYYDYICYICSKLGIEPISSKLHYAADIPVDVSRRMVASPHSGAVELLAWLKDKNYRTGLISDCFTDIPALWDATPFAPLIDVAVFSCFEGTNKADVRIFHTLTGRIGVKPEKCVYVADGMRNELANAASLGMHSVQIYIPEEVDNSPIRENWEGTVIHSLIELKKFLEEKALE